MADARIDDIYELLRVHSEGGADGLFPDAGQTLDRIANVLLEGDRTASASPSPQPRRLLCESRTAVTTVRLYRAPDRPGFFTYEIELPDAVPEFRSVLDGKNELAGVLGMLAGLCVFIAGHCGFPSLAYNLQMAFAIHERMMGDAIRARKVPGGDA